MRVAQSSIPISYTDAAERYHYYNSAATARKVALTIDDGPHGEYGHQMMDTLEQAQVPATFFYIGIRAMGRPDIVREASRRGFDVEVHSFTHSHKVDESRLRMALELHATDFFLRAVTGNNSLFYRPPFLLGVGTDATLNPYTPFADDVLWSLELGYLPVGADLDPKDWLATKPEQIVENLKQVLQDVPNGHMVLLHEDKETAQALPQIISLLRERGYEIVPLAELLTPPTVVALTHTLALGDTDQKTDGEVSQLQWFLYEEDYLDAYAVTGVFDQQTHDGLMAFQQNEGVVAKTASSTSLATPGIADSLTRARVLAVSTPTAAPAATTILPTYRDTMIASVKQSLKTSYIEVVPNVLFVFVYAVKITLVLVFIRLSFLLCLLVLRWVHGPFYGSVGRGPEMAPETGVTVLIAAFNEEENIAATIESLIHTHHKNREIIVINDGSKDNTIGEVRRVMALYPDEPIRLIDIENGGKARALNFGLEVASHDIIAVLDADAVLSPDALSRMAAHFVDPRVAAVAGKVRTTESNHVLDVLQALEYAVGQNIDKKAYGSIGAVGVVPGPAGAWRRELLRKHGGFHTDTLVEDQEMTLTLLRDGGRVIYEERAVAYTETPHTLRNFLKQRFRWVYGTIQCFWKHKGVLVRRPASMMSLVVMPNIFVYNILLPLTYPIADSALIIGVILGQWETIVIPFLLFTFFDIVYAMIGAWGEMPLWKTLVSVPIQRVVYRWLLYYTVMRGVVSAVEGRGAGWNKFKKVGDAKRYYSAYQVVPEVVTTDFQGPEGTLEASINAQDTVSLSRIPRHDHTAGETSSPARSPKVLVGEVEDPKT